MGSASRTTGERTIYVCRGGGCRKTAKKYRALRGALEEQGRIRDVRCQKICKGPVFGVEVRGRLEWFHSIEDKKSRRAAVQLLTDGELAGPMAKRRCKKRRGKLRD